MRQVFAVTLVAAAAFVWLTGGQLPPVVASHFGPGGVADGHMGRGTYTALMLAVVVGVPLLIAASTTLATLLPPQWINLPHKAYWLAPERRAASLAALSGFGLWFATALTLFLCAVHGLVIQANRMQPPLMDERGLFVALGAFGVATLLWVVRLYRRFGRVA